MRSQPAAGWLGGVEVIAAVLVAAMVARPLLEGRLDNEAVQTWSTVFVSITTQALPFLVPWPHSGRLDRRCTGC